MLVGMGERYEHELDDPKASIIPMNRLVAGADSAPAPICDMTTGCITCGDVAIPLTVLRLDEERGLALCADDDGNRETVETDLVAPVEAGDRLLVHAGTAIARLDEEDPA